MMALDGASVLQLVRQTIGLSAHILLHDPQQLASQLTGRLLDEHVEPVERLLAGARSKTNPWLRPCGASLEQVGGARRRTLTGHTAGVNAVTVTPDSVNVISGASDGTIRVWDIDSGREIAVMREPAGRVESLAVTPDGQRVIAGSNDGTVSIWEWRSGRLVATFGGHAGIVGAVSCSRDGRRAASASEDGTIRLWDLQRLAPVSVLEGHTGRVNGVAFTPDGRRVVSASSDQTLRVWDVETGAELARLDSSWGQYALDISADGRTVISGSMMVPIAWDLASGTRSAILTTTYGPLDDTSVDAVAITPDGTKVITASYRVVRVWDLERDYPSSNLATWTGHESSVQDVAVSPDGRWAVSASLDATIRVWSLSSPHDEAGTIRSTAEGPPVKWIGFGPDGETIALAVGYTRGEFGEDSEWESALGVGSMKFDWYYRVKDIAQSGDRGTLLVAVGNGIDTIDVREMASSSEGFGIWPKVRLSSDGRLAAGHNWTKGTLAAWDRCDGRTWQLASDVKEIEAIAVTPDGSRVVVGTSEGLLRVWDLANDAREHTLEGHNGRVNALIVDPNGRIVSCGEDGWVRVWNRELTEVELSLQLAWKTSHSLVVSGDGRRLAAVSDHGAASIWDLETGRLLLGLPDGTVKTSGEWNTDLPGRPLSNLHLMSRCAWAIACDGAHVSVWSCVDGTLIAAFTGDGVFETCSVSPDDAVVIVGTALGQTHTLALENPGH